MSDSKQNHETSSRFSLQNLSAAFARLSGASSGTSPHDGVAQELADSSDAAESGGNEVLNPRMIVEGMLFVGNSDGSPLGSREMAAHIRDVSPREVESLIDELNDHYEQANSPYRIVSSGTGFRFSLTPKFDVVNKRFQGRVREAKLTQSAIEVLAVVAYRQPVDADVVANLRGTRSHSTLNQLVRRGLLRIERPSSNPRKPVYSTTERFNTLFRISSPQDLPNSEDLDDQ